MACEHVYERACQIHLSMYRHVRYTVGWECQVNTTAVSDSRALYNQTPRMQYEHYDCQSEKLYINKGLFIKRIPWSGFPRVYIFRIVINKLLQILLSPKYNLNLLLG